MTIRAKPLLLSLMGEGVVDGAFTATELGDYTITWTATDAAGNATSATQTVTISDAVAPVIADLPDVFIDAQGLSDSNPGEGMYTPSADAVMSFVSDNFFDATEITLSADKAEGYLAVQYDDAGKPAAYEVNWTATDGANNVSQTALQLIYVSDVEAPQWVAEIADAPSVTADCH